MLCLAVLAHLNSILWDSGNRDTPVGGNPLQSGDLGPGLLAQPPFPSATALSYSPPPTSPEPLSVGRPNTVVHTKMQCLITLKHMTPSGSIFILANSSPAWPRIEAWLKPKG